MYKQMKCRICGQLSAYVETITTTSNGGTVICDNIPSRDIYHLDFYLCPNCNHGQIEYLLSNDYYEKWMEPFDENSIPKGRETSHRSQIIELLSYLPNKQNCKSLIEIGCGFGADIKIAEDYFDNVVGVDPSFPQIEICRQKGLNVKHGYFDKQLNIKQKFNAFMAFQVFEHITNPYEILEYAYELLDDGGVGLIEIPNGQQLISETAYFNIITEHVNYFTPQSLCTMAHTAGFDTLCVKEVFNCHHIAIFLRKAHKFAGFNKKYDNDQKIIQQLIANTERIGVWGAGAKARSFITMFEPITKLTAIFDMNKDFTGKYMPGVPIPISYPNAELINKNDTIMIFASAYNLEITEMLRNIFHFEGRIIYLDGIIRDIL